MHRRQDQAAAGQVLGHHGAEQRGVFGVLMAEHLAGGGLILAAVHDPLPIEARAVEVGG